MVKWLSLCINSSLLSGSWKEPGKKRRSQEGCSFGAREGEGVDLKMCLRTKCVRR